jgi:Zn-dependent M28 family amino/carboxypeptidase
MRIVHSQQRLPSERDVAIQKVVDEVSTQNLREYVEKLSFPRHFFAEHHANRRARDWLLNLLSSYGYEPALQGDYDNIVVTSGGPDDGPFVLLGAHYDSVPGTPGADDNASAVSVCLECARVIRRHDIGPVMIVFFNREEDGLIGSREFVAHLAEQSVPRVGEAHIFEMVGYRDLAHGSQRLPHRLPLWSAPRAGDFLALVANKGSNKIAESLTQLAGCYVPDFPVVALKAYLGIERLVADLQRSDHAPFWQAGIPAIMWTDTSEFRNPHYHRASDTPDTLDYEFMGDVTKLALARAVSIAQRPSRRSAPAN